MLICRSSSIPSARSAQRKARSAQRGYALLLVIFFVTVLLISLAAVLPQVNTALKREREEEMIHRANQYVRAIQLYYRKFQRYPSSIDQLQNTNNMRFLRKKYLDPITGKDDWQLLQPQQVRPRQPNPMFPGTNGQQGLTPASSLGGGLGGTAAGAGGGLNGGTGANGTTGVAGSTLGGTTGGIAGASSPFTTASGGAGARTFGGGVFVGVSSSSEKESLKELDGKNHYNEWQFVYDPTYDPSLRRGAAGIPGAQPVGQPGQPGGRPINPAPGGLGGPGMGTGGTTTPH